MGPHDTWRALAREMATLPLSFNAPLSDLHAAQLIDDLNVPESSRVLDLGCGWGELLLRMLAMTPGVTGTGVDHDATAMRRATAAAVARFLHSRVTFIRADILTYSGPLADTVFAVGVGHVARVGHMLSIVGDQLAPGGSVLFADGYWKRPPTAHERAAMPHQTRELGSLDQLGATARDEGFEVLSISVADDSEMTSYALRTHAGLQQQLSSRDAEHEGHILDRYICLWSDVLCSLEGFAYLVLRR